MEYKGRPDVVSWLKPARHFKVDELSLKRVMLVEIANVIKCNKVAAEIVWTHSVMSIYAAIDEENIVVVAHQTSQSF